MKAISKYGIDLSIGLASFMRNIERMKEKNRTILKHMYCNICFSDVQVIMWKKYGEIEGMCLQYGYKS